MSRLRWTVLVLFGGYNERSVAATRELQRRDPLVRLTWLERRELAAADRERSRWMR